MSDRDLHLEAPEWRVIPTVSYRAVVINGLVHNDDPAADETWMPSGSFWTQPKGDGSDSHVLEPGSYFSSQGEFVHHVASMSAEAILYVRSEGKYEILPGGE